MSLNFFNLFFLKINSKDYYKHNSIMQDFKYLYDKYLIGD